MSGLQAIDLPSVKVAFESGVHKRLSWMGVPCFKHPCDLMIYQELLYRLRPTHIIECGTHSGGTTLYLAHLCDLLSTGHVISIDTTKRKRPAHPRIQYVNGSSVVAKTVSHVRRLVRGSPRVMVILDSDHRAPHVLKELRQYSPMVTRGSYIIVEDTVVGGYPVRKDFGPGPLQAVSTFLEGNLDFVIDRSLEKLGISNNVSGYLRCVGRAS